MPSIAQNNPPTVPASAPEQIPACAASSSDEHFANVRKSVIAAAGECEQ